MGRHLDIDSGSVRPSQDFLKPGTVRHIADCYARGAVDELPPEPIVRAHPESGEIVAIDGHNLLAVHAHMGKATRVFVAEHAEDTLPGDDEATAARNRDLRDKFDLAIATTDQLVAAGIRSMHDLNTHANIKDILGS